MITNSDYFDSNAADISESFDAMGANLLVAIVHSEQEPTTPPTFNGDAFTIRETISGTRIQVRIYTLESPDGGSQTLALDAASGGVAMGIVAVSGIYLTNPIVGTDDDFSDTQSNPSMETVITQNDAFPTLAIAGYAARAGGDTSWEPLTGNTELYDHRDLSDSNFVYSATYQAFSSTGSKTQESTVVFGSGFVECMGAGILLTMTPTAPPQIIEYL